MNTIMKKQLFLLATLMFLGTTAVKAQNKKIITKVKSTIAASVSKKSIFERLEGKWQSKEDKLSFMEFEGHI
jgi:hypothetical protein